MKTINFKLLAVLLMLMPLAIHATDTKKPFVIPELKEWKAKEGQFLIDGNTRILAPKGNAELKRVAEQFADDYNTMFGQKLQVAEGKANKGDIEFVIKKDKQLGEEGYTIKIDNKLTIAAPEAVGVFWATRTLLQMKEQGELPKGEIRDFPDFKMRGFLMDCGRKFIPLNYLQSYVKIMAYYKMNTFSIHLNDNAFPRFFQNDWAKTPSAFRLESETFPGLTAHDGSYSKQEFIDLQILGENNFVTIIPEIDVPAHSLAFAQYNSELGSQEYGLDHLDLFKPETYEFVDALFDEYLKGDNPVFRGKIVHVGTDEYSNEKQEVVEKFRYFTNYCIELVEGYGKKAAVWGALTHAKGETPVKVDNVLMYDWHNPYAQPDSMIQLGYDLISIPDGLLYIVPKAGYYYDYLNHEKIYKEWTPNIIADKTFDYDHPQIKGGMFAVWNDHADNGVSVKDVHHRTVPAIQTLAAKMWTGKEVTVPFGEFFQERNLLSEAPGVNLNARVGKEQGVVLEMPVVKKNSTTPLTEIGYDYTITFDLECQDEERGAILFQSPEAEFYLSDPIKGMMGFSRDGYLNTFRCKVKKGDTLKVEIRGTNETTQLFVNGKLVDDLYVEKHWHNKGEFMMQYISTLVFPLAKTGNFNSKVTNLKVMNYAIMPL